MARLYVTGFELNSTTSGIEQNTWSGAGATIQTGTVRTGTYAMKATSSSGTRQGTVVQFAGSTSNGPYFARFYLNIGTLPSVTNVIFVASSGAGIGSTIQAYISLTSTGTLLLFYNNAGTLTQIGSASSALSTNTWYRIEFKFDKSGGNGANIVEGQLNGSAFATASNLTVQSGILSLRFGTNLNVNTDTAGIIYFDDIALNDSTGASQTGYPGDSSLVLVSPNAAGDTNTFSVQVGGTAGSANNFTRVDEIPPDDATSYNASNTANQEDLFAVGSSGIGGGSTINIVMVGARFANITSIDNTTTIKLEIEKASAGTISQSSAIIPDITSWVTNNNNTHVSPYPLVLYNDPDSSAWTTTTIGTMQIGYKLITANVDAIGVTSIWAYIDYVPSNNPSVSVSDSSTTSENVPTPAISYSVDVEPGPIYNNLPGVQIV